MAFVGHLQGDGAGVLGGIAWVMSWVDDSHATAVAAVEGIALADDSYRDLGLGDGAVKESRLLVGAVLTGLEHLRGDVYRADAYRVGRMGSAFLDTVKFPADRIHALGVKGIRGVLSGVGPGRYRQSVAAGVHVLLGASFGGCFFAGVNAAGVLGGVLGVGQRALAV